MDYHRLPRHLECCWKNPKNIIDEKDGIIQLTKDNLEKVKQLPKSLQRHKAISYTCLNCGEKITLNSFLEFKNFDTCFKCDRKQTCLKKYGGIAPAYNEKIKKQISQSHLSHTIEEIEKSNQKRKQTCLKKYGVEAVVQNKIIKQKQLESNLEKFRIKN